jgi:polyribonucleotide nucleotidyltransferase
MYRHSDTACIHNTFCVLHKNLSTDNRKTSHGMTINSSTTLPTNSNGTELTDNDSSKLSLVFPAHFHSGPSLELGFGRFGLHTYASVVAKAGSTTILCTVAREPLENSSNGSTSTSGESFLTVEFRQRSAAVGQIPSNRLRNDQGRMMSASEVLASRIIDRSLRPLLKDESGIAPQQPPAHYHILAAVQAIDLWAPKRTGHPIATALNAASAALFEQLKEPVAATVLAVMSDGTILQDPGPASRQVVQVKRPDGQETTNSDEVEIAPYCVGELLYAGTRTHAIMMEWTSIHDSLPEDQWPSLLELAAATIQPILDTIDELHLLHIEKQEKIRIVDKPDGFVSEDEAVELTSQIRTSLGLPPIENFDVNNVDDDKPNEMELNSNETLSLDRNELLRSALSYCHRQMGDRPIQSLFGVRSIGIPTKKDNSLVPVVTHRNPDEILTKRHRGRRETVMNQEIYRLVDEYLIKEAGYKLSNMDDSDNESVTIPESDRRWLQQKVGYIFLKHGLWETSFRFGTRSDGRRNIHVGQGWKTVRPLQMIVPVLPDSVHGSAVFARGDTQVLCTVTLGAPREGQPLSDPYQPTTNPQLAASEAETTPSSEDGEVAFEKLPIGSLRFLRTQEALESDLNSRKSLADKERTGDSGNLAEVKRAFLQYDFPAYSTGEVPKRGGMDRRSVGHGALAERAVLPVMPEAHIFPYAIRITSEVTDSNGSSSMASVCGATLALRDAGVPLKASVAGVSVGLAVPDKLASEIFGVDNNQGDSNNYSLLLDITGTEDHVSVIL